MSHEQTIGVSLDAIFPGTGAGVAVSSCTSDWRQVQPGDAFVAILDENGDGHDDVAEAVEGGAAAIIAERPVPVNSVPTYVVEDSRVALGELCHALADHPSRRLHVVGVIGTQGKSTVVALLESILTKAGCEVGVLSSLRSYDGMSRGPGVGATLSPAALADRLARMEAAGCTHALVEISSQSLCQQKLAGVELDTVVSTAVGAARLDLHHNPQNYRDALRRAFDYLGDSGLAVLHGDDPVNCRWLADLDAPSLTYGLGGNAQITAEIVERNACETTFVLTAGCESAAVRTTIVGDHHVSNCLAAAAAAIAHGIDIQTIAAGIEAVTSLPARMERIDCGQQFALFVDAAGTAAALAATLRTARRLASARVVCVLGDSLPASLAEVAALSNVVRKMADVTIVTDSVASANVRWRSTGGDGAGVQVAADRGEAIAWAVAMAEPGDVVVIAGSRGSSESGFGDIEITEAEAARELLYARAGSALRLVG